MDALVSPQVPVRSLRIMLVEDESLIAMLLEDMLSDLGHCTVGPFGDLTSAIEAANSAPMDIAILDVNINGGDTYPIARVLTGRAIPFVFSTGYNRSSLPIQYQRGPVLQKPFRLQDLRNILREALP